MPIPQYSNPESTVELLNEYHFSWIHNPLRRRGDRYIPMWPMVPRMKATRNLYTRRAYFDMSDLREISGLPFTDSPETDWERGEEDILITSEIWPADKAIFYHDNLETWYLATSFTDVEGAWHIEEGARVDVLDPEIFPEEIKGS